MWFSYISNFFWLWHEIWSICPILYHQHIVHLHHHGKWLISLTWLYLQLYSFAVKGRLITGLTAVDPADGFNAVPEIVDNNEESCRESNRFRVDLMEKTLIKRVVLFFPLDSTLSMYNVKLRCVCFAFFALSITSTFLVMLFCIAGHSVVYSFTQTFEIKALK